MITYIKGVRTVVTVTKKVADTSHLQDWEDLLRTKEQALAEKEKELVTKETVLTEKESLINEAQENLKK
ncbi:MAG: hypothetical protein JW827_10230, partial [Spirochaetes bacterium]|nr:hypothetical protein [Spirochaetota bacterium]